MIRWPRPAGAAPATPATLADGSLTLPALGADGPGPLGPRSPTARSRLELVAQSSNGQHVGGIGGIVLDLHPQPPDVDVDEPPVTEVPVAPHVVEQRLP